MPHVTNCQVCRNPMWWDTTPPYAPIWYCSVCNHPPERRINSAATPPPCPAGCSKPVTDILRDGTRRYICH